MRCHLKNSPGRIQFAVALVLFAATLPARAQQKTLIPIMPVGSFESTGYYLSGSDLVSVDFETYVVHRRSLGHALDVFHPRTIPMINSSAVSPDGRYAWLWDYSVGSTIKIGLQADTTITVSQRLSSQTQFNHAGDLNPITGTPLAFGGYGYYRVKDFMVTFSEELDTWTEVPIANQPAPEGRMGALMSSSWHPSKILVYGGDGELLGSVPPAYNVELHDAWIFDFETSSWEETPLPEWLGCSLMVNYKTLGYLPGDPDTHSLFVVVGEKCQSPDEKVHDVYQWFPETGRVQLLGNFSTTLPVYALPTLGYVDADSSTFKLIYWRPIGEKGFGDWDTWTFEFPIEQFVNEPRTEYAAWMWAFLFVSLVSIGALGGARIHRRRGERILATFEDHSTVIFRARNIPRKVQPFSSHAYLLLEHLSAGGLRRGRTVNSEDLLPLFVHDYPDIDSARVVKNRAIHEINQYFGETFGKPLFDRRRREDDRRRHVLTAQFSVVRG